LGQSISGGSCSRVKKWDQLDSTLGGCKKKTQLRRGVTRREAVTETVRKTKRGFFGTRVTDKDEPERGGSKVRRKRHNQEGEGRESYRRY